MLISWFLQVTTMTPVLTVAARRAVASNVSSGVCRTGDRRQATGDSLPGCLRPERKQTFATCLYTPTVTSKVPVAFLDKK